MPPQIAHRWYPGISGTRHDVKLKRYSAQRPVFTTSSNWHNSHSRLPDRYESHGRISTRSAKKSKKGRKCSVQTVRLLKRQSDRKRRGDDDLSSQLRTLRMHLDGINSPETVKTDVKTVQRSSNCSDFGRFVGTPNSQSEKREKLKTPKKKKTRYTRDRFASGNQEKPRTSERDTEKGEKEISRKVIIVIHIYIIIV